MVGKKGERKQIKTKEEADHSLPYMIAVALLDGEVTPDQYLPERIIRPDVQSLLQKITIRPSKTFTELFPKEMRTHLKVETTDGKILNIEKGDYPGFNTHPMKWEEAFSKMKRLCKLQDESLIKEIAEAIKNLENIQVNELMNLLQKVKNYDERSSVSIYSYK